jgi:DNA-binding NarL/FixJ family response regulator
MTARDQRAESDRGPVRVLLADDQRLVRESLGTLLGLLDGIELVATASDGEEVIALCDEHQPEVVLMDLRMPRLDGIGATGRLHERHPDVRVIKSHVNHLFAKAGLRDRAQAVNYAYRTGIATPPH